MKLKKEEAEKIFGGILASVEAGVTTPSDAMKELAELKAQAPAGFNMDYTLEDLKALASLFDAIDAGHDYEYEEGL